MTGKRYFKRMWEAEYYIFDSEIISEKEFDEKVEYEDYQAFADSMMGDEVVNKLNELNEENRLLKKRNKRLKEKIQRERTSFIKTEERWSKEAENKIKELSEENEELKRELQTYRKVAGCFNCRYHNYDWYDDGDEFEVCDIGNDVTEGICEKWEEL